MLVDHHCHLDFPQFEADRDAIVARATQAGVTTLVTICTRIRRFDAVRMIAERYPNVFCSVGTHPHNAHEELDIAVDEIVALAQHPKVVAIGEAGLDFHYKKSPPEAQARGFRNHIAAARLTGLPLEIHTREADDETLRILEDEMARGAFPAVLHCFTGGERLALRAVELGLAVSFSGVLTFKGSHALRAIAAKIPLDALLVETDAPYLSPMPHRGKTNEPAFVAHTAAVLAQVKGVSVEAIAAATTDNFFRRYQKARRPAGVETSAGDEAA